MIGHDVVRSPSYEVVSNFFADLYVAYHYGEYIRRISWQARHYPVIFYDETAQTESPFNDQNNYYTAFSKGLLVVVAEGAPGRRPETLYLESWRTLGGALTDSTPAYVNSPPQWVAAVNAVFTAWGDSPAANLIDKGIGGQGTYDRVLTFEAKLVSSDWTDFDKVKKNTAGAWTSQKQLTSSLLQAATLTADSYFFFLHLLIALATGDAASQSLAQQIVSASASSVEYPNDTFINQLVYLTLQYLADPMGSYGWGNAQLQSFLKDLESVSLGNDPGSTALKTRLTQHGKVLKSDASYPMTDPYNTTKGFNQRKTDTLAALDKARAAVNT